MVHLPIRETTASIFIKSLARAGTEPLLQEGYKPSEFRSDYNSLIRLFENPKALMQKASEAALKVNAVQTVHEAQSSEVKEAKIFLFNVGDFLFRKLWESPAQLTVWKEALSHLEPDARKALQESIVDRALNSKSLQAEARLKVFVEYGRSSIGHRGAFVPMVSNIIPAPTKEEVFRKDRRLKVLQSSLETPQHRLGGLGSVVSDLAAAHRAWEADVGKEAPSYQGFYPLYDSDKYRDDYLSSFEPYAVMEHIFGGKVVRSTIYKSESKQSFLLSPDPSCEKIFDIGETDHSLYAPAHGFDGSLRSGYLGSALAVFSTLYRGRRGGKVVDVVRADSPLIAASCFGVLDSMKKAMQMCMEMKRDECRFIAPMPGRVSVLHGLCGDSLSDDHSLGIGAGTLPAQIKALAVIVKLAHQVVAVSRPYQALLSSPDPLDNEGLSTDLSLPEFIRFKTHLKAVTNGFNPASFDPARVTGVARDMDSDLNATAFTDMKDEIKQALYAAGKLPDPTRPVVFFVGRWSSEKGVEHLPRLAKEATRLGAQFVVMGVNAGYTAPIDRLREMAKTNPYIRIMGPDDQQEMVTYTSKDSNGDCVEAKAKLGMLVRSCAMLGVVPSHKEALGLVPLETLLSCPVVLPYHQGFLDTMIPYKKADTEGKIHDFSTGATAFTYEDSTNAAQAVAALRQAFKEFVALDVMEQNKIMSGLRKQTIARFAWYQGKGTRSAIHRIVDVYRKALEGAGPRSFKYKDPLIEGGSLAIEEGRPSPLGIPVLSSPEGSEGSFFRSQSSSSFSSGSQSPALPVETTGNMGKLLKPQALRAVDSSDVDVPGEVLEEVASQSVLIITAVPAPLSEVGLPADVDPDLVIELEAKPPQIDTKDSKQASVYESEVEDVDPPRLVLKHFSRRELWVLKILEIFQKIARVFQGFIACVRSVIKGHRRLIRLRAQHRFDRVEQPQFPASAIDTVEIRV